MREQLRKTGINNIGNIPWPAHLCQFFETKEDLFEILPPYFKAGLDNKEFCMWVNSEPLHLKNAKHSLKEKLQDIDDVIVKKSRIEILDYLKWYAGPKQFDSDRVLKD